MLTVFVLILTENIRFKSIYISVNNDITIKCSNVLLTSTIKLPLASFSEITEGQGY